MEQRLPLLRDSLPYNEFSRLSLTDAARQVDFALLQTVLRLKLERQRILLLQSELRSNGMETYHFQRMRIFLPPVAEDAAEGTPVSSAPRRVAVNAAADFIATLAECLDAWTSKGVLKEKNGCLQLAAGGVMTHEIWLETTSPAFRPLPESPAGPKPPRMALVLLEMGKDPALDARALTLPFPFTGALAPDGVSTASTAEKLWGLGNDMLIQHPMQSTQSPFVTAGPDELTVDMPMTDMASALSRSQKKLSRAIGVIGYLGSRLTADPQASGNLAQAAAARGLLVLDAGASRSSRLAEAAQKNGLPDLGPVLVLDEGHPPAAILLNKLKELERNASSTGQTILLLRQSPETLEALTLWSAQREQRLELVPLHSLRPRMESFNEDTFRKEAR